MARKLLPLFADFAPVIVYYGAEYLWNLQVALILSITWVFGECAYKLARRQPFTLLFVYTSGVTILFGAVDLYLDRNALMLYEPVTTNFLTGALLLSGLPLGRALFREIAEKQQKPLPPYGPDHIFYVRFLAVIWVIYFWAKAAAYFWIARHQNMEQLLLVRLLAGTASMVALGAASLFLARPILGILHRLGLTPSARRPAPLAAEPPRQEQP